MASDIGYVQFVVEQGRAAGALSYKKMFGEFGVYVDGKIVALVCDNQLFVKPTDEGRSLLGSVTEAPPYPGAKPYFLVSDRVDDRDLLGELLRVTARASAPARSRTAPTGKRRGSSPKAAQRPSGRKRR